MKRVSEEDKVIEVINNIKQSMSGNGPYKITDKPKSYMYELQETSSYQCRLETTAGKIPEMKDLMNDRCGVLKKENYMTHGGIYEGKPYLINGNNTCKASKQTQEIFRDKGTIPYMEIDEKDLFELGESGIDTLALTLNPQDKNPRTPESKPEAVEWATKRISGVLITDNSGRQKKLIENRDSLSRMLLLRDWTSSAITKILADALNEYLTKIKGDAKNQTWIKYSEDDTLLKKKVKKATNNFTMSTYASTTTLGIATALDLIIKRDKDGNEININKNTIEIFTHSPNEPLFDKYKKLKDQLEKDINDFSFRGKKYKCIITDIMPQWRDKKIDNSNNEEEE